MTQITSLQARSTAALLTLSAVAGGLLFSTPAGRADTIVAAFGSPVRSGTEISLSGTPVFYDNTSTAFVEISNSFNISTGGTPPQQTTGSELLWGSGAGSSSLIFFGKPVPSNPYQPFDLGTLTYHNGTSDLDTLIFGASVTFYASNGGINSSTPSGTSQIGIVTTANLAVAGSEQHDADFITFTGLTNLSFNVLENASGTAELFGEFVNDPEIRLTGIALSPGSASSAFIGNGAAVPVPETSSLLAGLAALGLIGVETLRPRRATAAVQG